MSWSAQDEIGYLATISEHEKQGPKEQTTIYETISKPNQIKRKIKFLKRYIDSVDKREKWAPMSKVKVMAFVEAELARLTEGVT